MTHDDSVKRTNAHTKKESTLPGSEVQYTGPDRNRIKVAVVDAQL